MLFLFIAPIIGAAATIVDGIKPATSWPRKRLRRWPLGDLKKTAHSSVEPSYTLLGLCSTDEIHDAEKHQHQSTQSNNINF
jgi:hypothetical protein